jgi:iron complex transport system substrate-binding protein
VKALVVILLTLAGAAEAKPRAVSLDYCSDQYLLALADPDQILAVSRGADKDYSRLRETAAPYAKIRASAEEALTLEPDLVLRQWGGGPNAETAFARFGARVVSLGFPEDFDGVKVNIRQAAAKLDQEERGEAMIRDLDSRLAKLVSAAPTNARALYVTPGGVTAGAHTMIDAIIAAAGAVNIAAENGQPYWPALPAETLLMNPPEFIVGGFFRASDETINHWSAARHPAIMKLLRERPSVHLTPDLVSCAAFHSVEAAEKIGAALAEDRP